MGFLLTRIALQSLMAFIVGQGAGLRAGLSCRPLLPMAKFTATQRTGVIGKEPATAARRQHPGTDPAPRRGRGRSAAGAGGVGVPAKVHGYPCEGAGGAGVPAEGYGYPLPQARAEWGLPKECAGISCRRRRGWGGGCQRGIRVSSCEGAGGAGAASRERMGISYRRRWRGGGCRQKCMGSCRRRREQGMLARSKMVGV